ncbi:MAG: hypothetical protein F4X11_08310 [Acidobacteria bacterium]|nr:hypothetical protein [Acidobacteriota bacterium]
MRVAAGSRPPAKDRPGRRGPKGDPECEQPRGDLDEVTDSGGILVAVRRSKTDQEGKGRDVRFVKDDVA